MSAIEAETADQAWLCAVEAFRGTDAHVIDDSRNGPTRELLHAQLVIKDPRQRWVVSRNPPMNPAFAIAETFWVLAGREDAAFLTAWNSQISKYSGAGATLCGAYGKRLRSRFGLDQLNWAYEGLKANSSSRQFVLQIWDPATDLPLSNGQPRNPDIPCNICSLLKVRKGKLEWLQVLRSNDVFLGLPYDIVQFTTLQEILAGWLGVEVGRYVHLSDSLHVYERDFERVISSNPAPCPRNPDNLAIPKANFDELLPKICDAIIRLADPAIADGIGLEIIGSLRLPGAYHNLALVIAAESARRRKSFHEMETAMNGCRNPVLIELWRNWLHRCRWSALHAAVTS